MQNNLHLASFSTPYDLKVIESLVQFMSVTQSAYMKGTMAANVSFHDDKKKRWGLLNLSDGALSGVWLGESRENRSGEDPREQTGCRGH